jgi:prepilin-type N-terminal cleavage/methylation domain-containing protein
MAAKKRREGSGNGFTLIEIIIVLGIIGLLVGLAIPQYQMHHWKAKEAVLRENLSVLRRQIDLYYQDKGKYPASLQSLVQDGYLRQLPVDPMTGLSSTWTEVRETPSPEEIVMLDTLGVVDVKSGSELKSRLDGTLYNTW